MSMTDIWFRNPDRAMSTLAQEGVSRITWTRQHLGRLRMDGIAYVRQFYMHTPIRPKIMLIGIQGTSEYHLFSKLHEPVAVYPTWSGKRDSLEMLMDYIEKPWGEDIYRCTDLKVPSSLRPVSGQKHRVILHNCPRSVSGPGRQFWVQMDRIQRDHPEVELFVNGSKSFAVMFGLKFAAVDEGLSDAGDDNRTFRLPNGVAIVLSKPDAIQKLMIHKDWVKLLGFEPHELLSNNQARYAFRIRSARWAAKHWSNNFRWHLNSRNLAPDELEVSDEDYEPRNQTTSIVLRRKQFTLREADKILCDRCRIQAGCRFYRAESICGLGPKESEMGDLEKYFESRNAGRIVDGLAHIVRLQARRLEAAMDNEASDPEGDLDPEITKMMKQVFDSGVKLAKLVDPNLAGPGTRVQVNVGTGGTEVISQSSPREMMSVIVDTLERGGIPRDQITPNMVAGVLQGMANQSQQQAIEAQVLKYEDVVGDAKVVDAESEVTKVQVARSRDDS
jgi:hypothetical protein